MDSLAFLLIIALMLVLLTVKVPGLILLEMDLMTNKETTAINTLKELVKNQSTAHEYMKEDIYLSKWLAVNDFNVDATFEQLQKHLLWREHEKIDSILEENWIELNSIFPYTCKTKDKKGRPLVYFDLGQWNVAKFADENSLDSLGRYFVKILEESNAYVRRLRAEGNNINQFQMIVNLNGFSMKKHGCLKCLYFYRSIGKTLQAHFPRSTERKVFINVPPLFEMVYLFLGEQTQKLIKVYGQDRSIWELVLLEYIDRDQIPGGLLLPTTEQQQKMHIPVLNISTASMNQSSSSQ